MEKFWSFDSFLKLFVFDNQVLRTYAKIFMTPYPNFREIWGYLPIISTPAHSCVDFKIYKIVAQKA